MGLTTLVVLGLGLMQIKILLLPSIYIAICFFMIILNKVTAPVCV